MKLRRWKAAVTTAAALLGLSTLSTGMAAAADNDVIVKLDAEWPGDVGERLRHFDIGTARLRIA